jgi:hypothetical protein
VTDSGSAGCFMGESNVNLSPARTYSIRLLSALGFRLSALGLFGFGLWALGFGLWALSGRGNNRRRIAVHLEDARQVVRELDDADSGRQDLEPVVEVDRHAEREQQHGPNHVAV